MLAPTTWSALDLSVCYDRRFPQPYRLLAEASALFLAVSAVFTRTTGQVHWHVLLRAQVIETGRYMLVHGQYGTHGGGRPTYGHSMIVDP